jgi:hypothetical protein
MKETNDLISSQHLPFRINTLCWMIFICVIQTYFRVKTELNVIYRTYVRLNVIGHFVRRPCKRYFKACRSHINMCFEVCDAGYINIEWYKLSEKPAFWPPPDPSSFHVSYSWADPTKPRVVPKVKDQEGMTYNYKLTRDDRCREDIEDFCAKESRKGGNFDLLLCLQNQIKVRY